MRRSFESACRSLRAAALSLVVVLGPWPAGANLADAQSGKLYEDALQRYQKKDLAGAIIQLKNALQIDKNLLPVHVLLGHALLATSDVGAAEVAFTEALRLGVDRAEVVIPLARSVVAQGKLRELLEQPKFATAGLPASIQAQLLLIRASVAADLGDARAAIKSIEEARAASPQSAEPWFAEVPVRLRTGQFREAQVAVERGLSIDPNSPDGLYQRATIAHLQGNAASAIEGYGHVLRVAPTYTEALVSRAALLLDRARVADAARDVAELVRSSAKDPRGYYLQSLIAERQGDMAGARAALTSITAMLDPVPLDHLRYRPQALMLGGLAHFGLNEPEKAKPYLEAAQVAQPNTGVAKVLARLYLADKNVESAIEVLTGYLRSHRSDSQALLLLASAHMSQGRHARASQLMQDALRTQDRPDLRTMLGMSLVGGGKFGDALGEFEAAYKKDPTQLQAGVALATFYLESARAGQAARVAEEMATRWPTSPGLKNLLGVARARAGNTTAAKAAFEAAVRLDPTFASPEINLARLEIANKSFDAAAMRLNAVLSREPNNIEALRELAGLLERRGELIEAQRLLERADDVGDSTQLQAGLELVDFHLRHGNVEAAQEATKRLASKAPDAVSVLLALAKASLANRDAAAARTSLTRAANLSSNSPGILLQVALLQVAAGHLPGAAYTLDKALVERPDFAPAQALLAEVEILQGDFAKAEQRIRKILTSQPRLALGHALAGDLALARGQRSAAIDAFRRAHQIAPSTESMLRWHRMLVGHDEAGAARLAEDWLKTHPRDIAVRGALADGYARLGNLKGAKSAYEALLKINPDDPEALNNLAQVMVLMGDPAALKLAESALQKKPGAAHIIGTVGWAAFKAGQPDRALQLLRDARLRNPQNPDTRFFLATVLATAGRRAEAREELEAALRGGSFTSAKDAERLLQTLK